MKISVFTDLRFTESSTPTGVGKHIAQMVQGLDCIDGNDVSILAARDQISEMGLKSESTLSFLPAQKLPLPWKAAEALWTLAGGPAVDSYCKGADWVYCPKNDFIPLRNTKLAVTIHGAHELDPQFPQSDNLNSRLNRIRRRMSYQQIIDRADLILTVSDFLKNQMMDWFGCEENKIIKWKYKVDRFICRLPISFGQISWPVNMHRESIFHPSYIWSRNAFGNRTAFFYPKGIHSSTGGYCGRYCTGSDRRSDTVWTYEAVL